MRIALCLALALAGCVSAMRADGVACELVDAPRTQTPPAHVPYS